MKFQTIKIDAEGKILGRLATEITKILTGKNSPNFAPNIVPAIRIVVSNAAKVKVTGKKTEQILYRHHSGYPGGMSVKKYKEVISTRPERVLFRAVQRMLPKNKLQREFMKHLRIIA